MAAKLSSLIDTITINYRYENRLLLIRSPPPKKSTLVKLIFVLAGGGASRNLNPDVTDFYYYYCMVKAFQSLQSGAASHGTALLTDGHHHCA